MLRSIQSTSTKTINWIQNFKNLPHYQCLIGARKKRRILWIAILDDRMQPLNSVMMSTQLPQHLRITTPNSTETWLTKETSPISYWSEVPPTGESATTTPYGLKCPATLASLHLSSVPETRWGTGNLWTWYATGKCWKSLICSWIVSEEKLIILGMLFD